MHVASEKSARTTSLSMTPSEGGGRLEESITVSDVDTAVRVRQGDSYLISEWFNEGPSWTGLLMVLELTLQWGNNG